MRRLDRLLCIVLLVETGVLIGAFLLVRRKTIPRPPLPALARSHALRSDLEALVADCKTAGDLHQLAEIYTAYGYYAEAEACYEFLLLRRPDDPQLLFEAGFLLSRQGRWKDANRRFAAALDAGHPTPGDCWYFIGRNYLRAEQPDNAAEAFAKAGDLASAQLELARLKYRSGDVTGAQRLLQLVLAKEPNTIAPNVLAYLCSLELGDWRSATQYAERAADTTDRIFSPFYTQWERLDKSIPRIGYRRRFAAAQQAASERRFDDAERLWLEARQLEWSQFSVFSLAQMAKLKGDLPHAIELLQEIIERRGPSTEELIELADNYAAMNDFARAIDVAKQAVEAQSEENLEPTFGRLSHWSEILGRSDDARRFDALQKLWKGKAAFWLSDWVTAETCLTSASSRIGQSDEAWFFLAETYRRLNKNAAAMAAYQRCLSLNPQHGGAHRGIAILGD